MSSHQLKGMYIHCNIQYNLDEIWFLDIQSEVKLKFLLKYPCLPLTELKQNHSSANNSGTNTSLVSNGTWLAAVFLFLCFLSSFFRQKSNWQTCDNDKYFCLSCCRCWCWLTLERVFSHTQDSIIPSLINSTMVFFTIYSNDHHFQKALFSSLRLRSGP